MKQSLLLLLSVLVLSACTSEHNKVVEKKRTSYHWLGEWRRDIWQNNAGLVITSVRGDSIVFELNASSGGHTGDVTGSAIISGNRASFYSLEEYDSCRLYFEISGDTLITITQGEGNCYAAMGVTFEGRYFRDGCKAKAGGAGAKEAEASETMLSVGVLETAGEDSALRALTVADYDLFLNSSQMYSDEEDLDSLHCRVRVSGVRGLYTIMENIIMIDSSMHLWAAAIDSSQRVQYFTNVPAYSSRLPRTIEEWRSRFADYPIVYRSK